MEGFFSKKETESQTRPDGKVLSCVTCGLAIACDTPRMDVVGNGAKRILNICTSPGAQEDGNGKPYSSREARVLEKQYKAVGIDLMEDCWNMYAVRCNTDKIEDNHVDCCRRAVMKAVKQYKPHIVVLFGQTPLESVIKGRFKKDLGAITKWQGYCIPDQDLRCFILPTFAASFIEDSKNKVLPTIWKRDFEKVKETLSIPFPVQKEPTIHYLEEEDIPILDTIKTGVVSIDYETTGLKPHAPGHRIVCASVAVDSDTAYVFMMPDTKKGRRPFTDLLQRESVLKTAQNMKFEDTWTNVRLRVPVRGWVYDSMLAAHIIDNREGTKGLKFQAYARLGVVDYSSEISPYLRAKEERDANCINQIDTLLEKPGGARQLMKYCALDTIYERRLGELTRKHMTGTQGKTVISPEHSNFPLAYSILHHGTLALAEAERAGIRVDTEYADKMDNRLTKKIQAIEEKLYKSTFYRHWTHSIGNKKPNLNSGKQLEVYLYRTKKIKPMKYTENGYGSTDEEALRMLKITELDWIIERSKLQKIRDTYLKGFVREQVNGYLHPFFSLHTARTYRSSSNNPNFQNIPKRDYTAMQTVRKALYARPGHQLLEMDYSGIEVAIAAAYHQDPTMIKYITDPTSDMHGDTAAKMFKIKKFDRRTKSHSMLRSAAKNSFVFPQFYGDYYKNCAMNTCANWLQMPTSGAWTKDMGVEVDGKKIGEHLISVGLLCYDHFEKHIQEIEKHFWDVRFPVYKQWKEDHYADYLKKGYVSLKTGFVCTAIMSKNDAINYPVQGAAFHCLLWTFTRLTRVMKEKGMRSRLIGQIHDALVLDVHPDELLEVYALVQDVGVRQLKEAFKWINVPLELEAELCPVDGSWAEKKEWKPVIVK
jgi:uracil-DNA glycosylase family 4